MQHMHVQIEDRKNSLLLITFGIGVKTELYYFFKEYFCNSSPMLRNKVNVKTCMERFPNMHWKNPNFL